MKELYVCTCTECGTEFAMMHSDLTNMAEVTCPRCESLFPPPIEGEDIAGDPDEDDDDDLS